MSVINHNVIIATAYYSIDLEKSVKDWISRNVPRECQSLFSFNHSFVNGFLTVTMNPDGSKEGWEHSDLCDSIRDNFVEFIEDDFSYVEISYGEFGQSIVRGNNQNMYS